jgi:hypothetical protein
MAVIADHDHPRVVVASRFAWRLQRHFLFIGSGLFHRDKSQASTLFKRRFAVSSLGMSAGGRSPCSAWKGWCLWPRLVPFSHQHKPATPEHATGVYRGPSG